MSDGIEVSATRTELAQIMTPNEANVLGNVFGGAILSMIDLTASATAQRFAGTICVTASFDRVDFHEPIHIGNLVTMVGFVSHAGRTSMEITIDVYATQLASNTSKHTNTAKVTMVAMRDGKPSLVPKLLTSTREDKLRFLEGKIRKELRKQFLAELEVDAELLQRFDDARLDELLTADSLTEALGISLSSARAQNG
jgi:acyl-CoA hydrolase